MPINYLRAGQGLLLFITALLASTVSALEIGVTARYIGEFDSNAALTRSDTVADWIHRPGVLLTAQHAGARLEVDGSYDVERRLYREDLFEDETLVTGSTSLVGILLPNRLEFHASHLREETTIQAAGADTPANRQVINSTMLGPRLLVRGIRQPDSLVIDYRYQDLRARITETDSDRHILTGTYSMPLRETRVLALEANYTEVRFSNDLVPRYDRWHGMGRFQGTGARSELEVGAGYAHIRRFEGLDNVSLVIADLMLSHNFTPTASLTLTAERDQRDNTLDLLGGFGGLGGELAEDTDLNEIFIYSGAALLYEQTLGNNTLGLQAFLERQDYEDIDRDQDRLGAAITITRPLRPNLSLRGFAGHSEVELEEFNRIDRDTRFEVGLAWQPWQRLTASLTLGKERRTSGDPLAEYRNRFGMIELSYLILGAP